MKSSPAFALLLVLLVLCTLPMNADARTWYIKVDGTGDLPTIQAAVDVAAPGDVILVAAGRYTWANQGGGSPPHAMIHIARFNDEFILRSESGPEATIIDMQRQGRGFFVDGFNSITIDGFTIKNGLAPAFGENTGGGIAIAHTTGDIIKNCIFENNEAIKGGGLFLGGNGTATIEGCVFRNNTATGTGGGMWFAFSPLVFEIIDCQVYNNTADFGGGIFGLQAALVIENTVIVNNTATTAGGGLCLRESWPSTVLTGCTVSANDAPAGSAVHFIAGSPVPIERTIFSFNQGPNPIFLESGAAPTFACCDVFGNTGGDALPAGAVDNGNNFSADPGFCNPPWSPNSEVNPDSPCLPGNHPDGASCGLIGARQACPTVPVETTTWGNVKGRFR